MTDLQIFPNSYLPAEIIEKVELDCDLILYFLDNEEIYYETISGYTFKLNEEQLKWSVNTVNPEVRATALSVDTAIKKFRKSREMLQG